MMHGTLKLAGRGGDTLPRPTTRERRVPSPGRVPPHTRHHATARCTARAAHAVVRGADFQHKSAETNVTNSLSTTLTELRRTVNLTQQRHLLRPAPLPPPPLPPRPRRSGFSCACARRRAGRTRSCGRAASAAPIPRLQAPVALAARAARCAIAANAPLRLGSVPAQRIGNTAAEALVELARKHSPWVGVCLGGHPDRSCGRLRSSAQPVVNEHIDHHLE